MKHTTLTLKAVQSRGFTEKHLAQMLALDAPEKIAVLPWVGNHWSDMPNFEACERLIFSLKDREQIRTALYLQGKHGMGIDAQVTDAEIDEFLSYNV